MQDLLALVEKTVVQLGFELVDFEMSNRGKPVSYTHLDVYKRQDA